MRIRSLFRYAVLLAVSLLLAFPARAVVPEKDFQSTLNSLLQELRQSYASALESDTLMVNNREQREAFDRVLKSADEVTIMLYTQRPEFTFDMAFALEEVSRVRSAFHEQVLLNDQYRIAARSGLRRYELLNETLQDMLRRQPADSLAGADSLALAPVPLEAEDPEKAALLDSCLYYTGALTALYGESVALALKDSVLCAETEARLQQAHDYAQANYADTQKNRYIGGNVNVIQILKEWNGFIQFVKSDLRMRYLSDTGPVLDEEGELPRTFSGKFVLGYAMLSMVMLLLSALAAVLIAFIAYRWIKNVKWIQFRPILTAILGTFLFVLGMLLIRAERSNPYWRMAYQLLTQYAWLTLAILVSLLIRMRAIFLPASAVPLFFPPTLLLFLIWQSVVNVRNRAHVSRADLRYMWVSVVVMAVTAILSLAGYSMIGVLLITFWTFLLALLHTITTLYYLMMRYYDDRVIRRKARYHEENPRLPLDDKDAFIEVTWLYDLLRMVVVPLMAIYSFPLSALLTSRAYQLSLTGADLMKRALVQGDSMKSFTLSNILLVIGLFFVFRYLIYLAKGLFRVFKLRNMIEEKTDTLPLKESDVNLSLANTIFSLLGWALYLLVAFSILDLPKNALTYITTGLAAGVGFALKDLINNFFYGIQLMAGRIRIGDKISCDGVRGVVKRVSYQITQVEDEDGSLIAFTNTDLFTKKFRNLNSGRNYELVKIFVSIRYGTDFENARQVILEALQPLMTKDKMGRDVVDPSFPIDVRFDNFGESSINLAVVLYTTVETHYTFPARAKEAIYNAFHEHGIEIPFPQRDVYLKPVPEKK